MMKKNRFWPLVWLWGFLAGQAYASDAPEWNDWFDPHNLIEAHKAKEAEKVPQYRVTVPVDVKQLHEKIKSILISVSFHSVDKEGVNAGKRTGRENTVVSAGFTHVVIDPETYAHEGDVVVDVYEYKGRDPHAAEHYLITLFLCIDEQYDDVIAGMESFSGTAIRHAWNLGTADGDAWVKAARNSAFYARVYHDTPALD